MKEPMYVHGGAAYRYSEALAERYTFESRFGESYPLYLHHAVDNTLWLPRNMCPGTEEDHRTLGEEVPYQYNFTPRNPEQDQIVRDAVALLKDWENFIVQAPTGWGKTYVGCAIAGLMKRKTLVITTKEDIVDQWLAAAKNVLGLSDDQVGVWRGDQEPAPEHIFIVGLVQSLMKGPERYPDFPYASVGFVICDEVHRMAADQFSQSMWWFPAALRMGLSATPYRKDGKEQVFTGHIGPVRLAAQQETMIPKVIVVRSQWKVPLVKRPDASGFWRTVKLPHEFGKTMHLVKSLAACKSRTERIVKFLLAALNKDRNTMVFSDTIDHLLTIHKALTEAGVTEDCIGYYVGASQAKGIYEGPVKDRKAQRERDKAKPILLATYAMASEATDIPWMDACVLASPRSDVVQIVGRIRREYPDKPQPVVLDIVDGDSHVFAAYAEKRLRWYQSLGCEVKVKS